MKFLAISILFVLSAGCGIEPELKIDFPRLPTAQFSYHLETEPLETFIIINQFHKDSIELKFGTATDSNAVNDYTEYVHLDSTFQEELLFYVQAINFPAEFHLYLDSSLSKQRTENLFEEIRESMSGTYTTRLYTSTGYISRRPRLNMESFYVSKGFIVYCHTTEIHNNGSEITDSLFTCDTLWGKNVIRHYVKRNSIKSYEIKTEKPIVLKS